MHVGHGLFVQQETSKDHNPMQNSLLCTPYMTKKVLPTSKVLHIPNVDQWLTYGRLMFINVFMYEYITRSFKIFLNFRVG